MSFPLSPRCPKGHVYDGVRPEGHGRRCKACRRMSDAQRRERKRRARIERGMLIPWRPPLYHPLARKRRCTSCVRLTHRDEIISYRAGGNQKRQYLCPWCYEALHADRLRSYEPISEMVA